MSNATGHHVSEAHAKKRVRRLVRTDRLREIREDQGLSQADVARHLGVSPSNVSRWESDKSKPRGRHAVRLLELLETELMLLAILALKVIDERAVYKVSEAARFLRLSERSYYAGLARGELPGVRIGRVIRVSGAQLARLLGMGEGVIATADTPAGNGRGPHRSAPVEASD
jgi:excisionase family DNA binding protein